MAVVRVWDGGDNSDPRDGIWANAAQSLSGAFGHQVDPVQAGDTVLVASDHVFWATSTLTISLQNNIEILSVNRTTEIAETGALEGINAASSYYAFTSASSIMSHYYIDGMELVFANSADSYIPSITVNMCGTYNNCKLHLGDNGIYTDESSMLNIYNSVLDFADVAYSSVIFSAQAHKVYICNCEFINTENIRYFLDANSGGYICDLVIEDCDLSDISITTVVEKYAHKCAQNLILRRCKVPSINLNSDQEFAGGHSITLEYCSTTGVNETPLGIYDGKNYHGIYKFDNTVYRYGLDEENLYSIKLSVITAAYDNFEPLKTPRSLGKWNKANNLTKLYIYFVSDDSDLTDRDVWVEVNYNSHTSDPVGKYLDTRATYGNQLTAGLSSYLKYAYLNQWTGSGFSTAYRFEITNVNPQEPGPLTVDFFLGKASTTVWVCPYMELV